MSLFFAFLDTTRGAAIKVPKKTLKIWISSKIVILMNNQNMLISMNIGALWTLKYKCKDVFEIFLKRCNLG